MNATVTNVTESVDATFLLIFGISAAILAGIVLCMLYFVWRYSRKRHPVPADFDGNLWAEIIWTVVPTLLVLGMFFYGWESFRALRQSPKDAMEVKVLARMWSWSFTYSNNKTSNRLVVPVGKPVKTLVTSKDVIHGFSVPSFRIKVDAVPGMTTYAWFNPEKEGNYTVFCTVYCGLQHAKMLSVVEVVSPAAFERWLAEAPAAPGAPSASAEGKALLDKYGCLGCHSLDGSAMLGPTLKGVSGRKATLIDPKGKEVEVINDDAAVRAYILGDKAGVLKGYDPVMPAFKGLIPDNELQHILDFLKTGDSPSASVERGKAVVETQWCQGCHSTDGSALVGPSFKSFLGSEVVILEGGKEKTAVMDRGHFLHSLKHPDEHRLKGFEPIMPAYPDLSAEEQESLLLYMESLALEDHGHAGHGGHDHHEGKAGK